MASRRDSSNGPDWKDIVTAIQEVERSWDVNCTLVVRAVGTGKHVKLRLEAYVIPKETVVGGVPPSGSAALTLSMGGAGALEQAMFRLVHDLDGDILRNDEGLQGLG
mgnify:CR=1 FL=1